MVLRRGAKTTSLFDRVLVPLDGSRVSESILPRLVPLARAAASEVVVFQVVPFLETILFLPEEWSAEATDTRRARAYVDAVARRLRQEGVDARPLVALGGPAPAILRAAERENATLIAMSTHARAGLRRLAFGSVTGRVLRAGARPLLLAPPRRPPAAGPASWLYLADPGPESVDPLPDVLRLSRRLGIPMTLLHARDENDVLQAVRDTDARLLVLAGSSEERRAQAERLLKKSGVPLLVLPA